MYSISELSQQLNVHNQTLRNWEKQGLITPARLGKVRVYSEEDLKRCQEIKKHSGKGISLTMVRKLMQSKI